MSTESVIPSHHLILYRPLLLLPSIFPSISLFRWASYLHQVVKVLELQFQHQSFQWIFRTDSFRIDWFDLLAVQGTLKSLQHHSSKASVLRRSAFLMVQLSYPYMTIGKTVTLTIWIFVSKVMSLLFNMLSRFVIVFLPRSKCLLISWLQSTPPVILEPPKIVCHCFHCFPSMKRWDQMPWSYFSECWILSQLFTLLFHFHQEAL